MVVSDSDLDLKRDEKENERKDSESVEKEDLEYQNQCNSMRIYNSRI